ncbi:MAG: hypothetical protein ACN6O2_03685 [Stenotrophomonas sp.]
MRGRTYMYALPLAYEDYAKLGIATDPMARMQAFSARYYDFFNLHQGWLVEAETEQEARSWETRWRRQLRAHAAPPPIDVPAQAGGHTEWLRGALAELAGVRDELQMLGFPVHASLHEWVGDRLLKQREMVASGEQAAITRFGTPQQWPAAPTHPGLLQLRDALDAYAVMQVPVADLLSPPLRAWWARNSLSSLPDAMRF